MGHSSHSSKHIVQPPTLAYVRHSIRSTILFTRSIFFLLVQTYHHGWIPTVLDLLQFVIQEQSREQRILDPGEEGTPGVHMAQNRKLVRDLWYENTFLCQAPFRVVSSGLVFARSAAHESLLVGYNLHLHLHVIGR